MTADEQEALSHQHYGYWCVPTTAGIAVFNHPSGKLLAIVSRWEEVLKVPMALKPDYTTTTPTSNLDLGDINDLL